MKNHVKTVLLLGILSGLLVGLGQLIGGINGAGLGIGLALVMNLGGYWFSDRLALRMSGARPVTEAEAPELYSIIRNLSTRADLPMPSVHIIPSEQPNAFATGRNPEHAAVAVTEGILQVLEPDELEGVLSHELAHVGNRDILISSVAATIAAAISWIGMIARWGAMFGDDDDNPLGFIGIFVGSIVAGLAAVLVQLAISRSREYLADETGARISGKPQSLASALQKIEHHAKQVPMKVNPSAAPMFIINPFSGAGKGMVRLFSTHPPTEERIRRLNAL